MLHKSLPNGAVNDIVRNARLLPSSSSLLFHCGECHDPPNRGGRPGASAPLKLGSSRIEPQVTPAHAVQLHWRTFIEATDEAGMSRRYGGIHFRAADLAGRLLERLVADQ